MKYGRMFINGGYRPAIVKEGPKWTQVVFIDGCRVISKKVKTSRVSKVSPLPEYTLRKMALRMLRNKTVLGLKQTQSKGARKILEEAKTC